MGRSAADLWKPAAGLGDPWSEAIQSSAVCMAIIVSTGELLQTNQAFGDQLGRDALAPQHLRLWDVLHPVEREVRSVGG